MLHARASRLWRSVWSREGALSLIVTVAGALALGLLPNLFESVPTVGESGWGLVAVAVTAVAVCALAASLLRSKPGVGIVVYLGNAPDWDRSRLETMEQDALRRHDTCFTVDPATLLRGLKVEDRVTLAFRVFQARLKETPAAPNLPESVSFYVTAPLPDAYRLGTLVRAQLHEEVSVLDVHPPEEPDRRIAARLIGMSEERGKRVFVAIRLDSALKKPPSTRDLERLRAVIQDPEQPPEFHRFRTPRGTPTPRAVALIVSAIGNHGMVDDALHAARHGQSEMYALPGDGDGNGDPNSGRCRGALVIRTLDGPLPDRTEVHEAFVRYVVHHWRRVAGRQSGLDSRLLFIESPVSTALALGAVLGPQTQPVPVRRRQPPSPSGSGGRS